MMKAQKTKVHFTDLYLINPTNPIQVNLIGAGGTGSKVLTALMEMNHSLICLGHPGLHVRLWDDDVVSEPNIGRQRFAQCEVGLTKAVALINRANRWTGTHWEAVTTRFERDCIGEQTEYAKASIYISCTDSVAARFSIAEALQPFLKRDYHGCPKYWLDFGNSQFTGQAILSTVGKVKQPTSNKFIPIAVLPFVTDEFGDLLRQSEVGNNSPSCSMSEALEKQDLYINAALAQAGCSLLWSMLRNGKTPIRGFFLNLETFRMTPLPIA